MTCLKRVLLVGTKYMYLPLYKVRNFYSPCTLVGICSLNTKMCFSDQFFAQFVSFFLSKACILAVGKAEKQVIVDENSEKG